MTILLEVHDGRLFTSADQGQTRAEPKPAARFLHLLPMLVLGAEQSARLGRNTARLRVTCAELGEAVMPAGGARVRKAFANRRYRVGGSRFTDRGWLLPLPRGLQSAHLVISWEVPFEAQPERLRHELSLSIVGEVEKAPTVFSMDVVAWRGLQDAPAELDNGAPVRIMPFAALDLADLQVARKLAARREDGRIVLHEHLDVPAMPLTRFWNLRLLGQAVERSA